MGINTEVPPHAGDVIRGKSYVCGATHSKAAQALVAFKPKRGARFDLFAKVI